MGMMKDWLLTQHKLSMQTLIALLALAEQETYKPNPFTDMVEALEKWLDGDDSVTEGIPLDEDDAPAIRALLDYYKGREDDHNAIFPDLP